MTINLLILMIKASVYDPGVGGLSSAPSKIRYKRRLATTRDDQY